MAAQSGTRGQLSKRGQAASTSIALPYLMDFLGQLGNVWHAEKNPQGSILMAVAENHQNYAALQRRLAACSDKRGDTCGYTSMNGLPRFRAALAGFLPQLLAPGLHLDADNFCVSAGCSALLDNLAFSLCEPGDAVLVPSPMYGAFRSDCRLKAGAVVVPCPTDVGRPQVVDGTSLTPLQVTPAALQAGFDAAVKGGHKPRLLILTHPGNPTGVAMTASELREAIAWARERALHVLVDEVYALGVFPNTDFVSSAQLLRRTDGALDLGPDVHLMWGFSKDFAVSGFRIGMLYSQNRSLLSALSSTAVFCAVSNLAQEAMAEVLEDADWTKQYLVDNAAIVQTAYSAAVRELTAAGVPCMPAQGGMFVWCDLRCCLRASRPASATPPAAMPGVDTDYAAGDVDVDGVPWQAEHELSQALLKEHKVLLTPGRACNSARAGFFRMCVTWMSLEGTVEGARRVANFARACTSGSSPRQTRLAKNAVPSAGPHGTAAWEGAMAAKL